MEQNKIRISIEELLYYILFAVILFTKGVGLDEGSFLFRSCLILGFLLLVCKFLIGKYSVAEILLAGVLGIWGVFTFKVTGSLGMFIYVILAVGMKNVSVKRVFVTGTAVWSVCMLYSVTAAVFWERTGVRVVHEKFGMGPILRESLGYTHPNVLHITYVLLIVFILYLCIDNKKQTFCAVCLWLIGNVYVFMYSLSSTGILTSVGLLVLFFYFHRRKRFSLIESLMIQALPALCAIASVVLPRALGDGMAYKIVNKIFNNRIWAIRVFFDWYNVTLFGGGNEGIEFSLDNSYIYALNAYGAIPLILLIAAYCMLMRYCIKKNWRMELAIICTFLFAGLSEPFLFNASIKNISVIFMGKFLYGMMEKRKCVFQIFTEYNKSLSFSCRIWENLMEQLHKIKWKWAACVVVTTGIICFLCLLPGEQIKVDQVYADEKWCDLYTDTVNLPKPPVTERTLYIEDMSQDINYFYFTRENSRLIEIMDLRRKVSISVYVALIAGMLYACGGLGISHLKKG